MKYKLTKETLEYKGRTLYRIEALENFGSVLKGEKGGFVESEANLSQYSDCWIGDNAVVYGNAVVSGDAKVYGAAKVYGTAKVYDNAVVSGDAAVFGNANIYGDAKVSGDANIYGTAKVYGTAKIYDNVVVYGNAVVYGYAVVFGDVEVSGNAAVFGDAVVYGNAQVYGDAKVTNTHDYIVFKNWWSSGRYLTWTRSNNKWKVGCFYGTGEELVDKAYGDSELSGREYKRLVDYVESIIQDIKGGGE